MLERLYNMHEQCSYHEVPGQFILIFINQRPYDFTLKLSL
jgi:hypothetical protein